MKRCGHLIERIADIDNLREAFLLTARGKNSNRETIQFRDHLEEELFLIHTQLLDGSYRFGNYHFFTIYDPKRRIICAANFRDRVTFQAMMRVCDNIFEKYQINCSFASRRDMGVYKAINKAQDYSRRFKWFVKMDVCNFFDSIDHDCLKRMLASLFKDRMLLRFFDILIDGAESSKGKGLPIGNLTSQYFANHYMAVADHYAKERLHVVAMVRYMDDVVFWGNDKAILLKQTEAYAYYLRNQLKLQLHPIVINYTARGFSFLGYLVYPHTLRLNQRSRSRFRHKYTNLTKKFEEGSITQQEYQIRLLSLLAFIEKADTIGFRKTLGL